MKLGVTGSQRGMTAAQSAAFRKYLARLAEEDLVEVHHGCCVGADAQAHAIVQSLGLWIVGHPPLKTWKQAWIRCDEYRTPAEYLARDEALAREVDLLVAFPKGTYEVQRSGTWATVRRARKHHTPVVIIWPDGEDSPE